MNATRNAKARNWVTIVGPSETFFQRPEGKASTQMTGEGEVTQVPFLPQTPSRLENQRDGL
jgi:hypothetical protein